MKQETLSRPSPMRVTTLLVLTTTIARLVLPQAGEAADAAPSSEPTAPLLMLDPPQKSGRFYGQLDYLFWFAKPAPLSVPLVSTGPISTTHHGLLGPPGNGADSTVLYGAPHSPAQGGSDSQNFPGFSGGRLTLGYELDDAQLFAIEASGFVLQQQTAGYKARGDSDGNPILGIPVYNTVPYTVGTLTIQPGEDSLPFSLPNDPKRFRANGIITGGITIDNGLRFWGADLTGVFGKWHQGEWEISGLVGARYLSLTETFDLLADIEGESGPFTGQFGIVSDAFHTKNQFYGPNFGLRGRYSSGKLSAEVSGRLAVGVTHMVVDVNGSFSSYNFRGPGVSDSGPEGVFAQPANEGKTSTDRLGFVPELQLKLGYALSSRLRVVLGYDFIFMSNVVRPTDQMNREIPKGQTFNQADPMISPISPARAFRTTDFFVQGLSLGLEFKF